METKMTKICWRVLRNKDDHALAMARLIELASGELEPESEEFEEFELLGLLIEHYESKKFPMDKPDPIEAIKFRMDQQGLSHADMRQYIGSSSKVSEVLNKKRPLSLSMIRRVHDGLGIPADILIQDINAIEWNLLDSTEEFSISGALLTNCQVIADQFFEKKYVGSISSITEREISPKTFITEKKREEINPFVKLAGVFGITTAITPTQNDEFNNYRKFSLTS